jgi:hypothetical protein
MSETTQSFLHSPSAQYAWSQSELRSQSLDLAHAEGVAMQTATAVRPSRSQGLKG